MYQAWQLMMIAGVLLTISGILFALCGFWLYSGMLWAGASCLLFASYHLRIKASDEKKEETSHEKTL